MRLGLQEAVLVLGPVLALLACGDGDESVGALGRDKTRIEQCTPVQGDSAVVFGDGVLRNEGGRSLRIDAVRLVQPDGLTIRDAFLLPIRNRTILGTGSFPPGSPVWQDRRKATGANVAPGEQWNLALTLERDGHPTKFADVEVAYTVGADSAAHRLGYALTVTDRPDCSGKADEAATATATAP